jgi:hypothetical protein
MEIVIVPHTHWDREWYHPLSVFQERLVRFLDALIDLLDREPALRHFHLDGQTALLDDYVALRPEREDDLRRLVTEGRLGVGPWFTQMDEFLTSGESQIRNLEWGHARAAAWGAPLPVDGPACGYLPDQFGHIGQMPQLLRMAGIDRAVVWRGVPLAVDRATFRWRAPDGSEVLAEYFLEGYDSGRHLDHATTSRDLAEQLERLAERARPSLSRDTILVPVGGDHHMAPPSFAPLVEAASRPGFTVRIASIASFLETATAGGRGAEVAGVPDWTGELRSAARSNLLPNVYSARAPQKQSRARVENLLERYAEPLAALVPGYPWPRAAFDEAWRRLLWSGAHDSVCGCSHDQVAHDVDVRNAEAWGIAAQVVGDAGRALAAQALVRAPATQIRSDAAVLLVNPSAFERDGVPGLGWAARVAGRSPLASANAGGDPAVGGPGWRWHRPVLLPVRVHADGDQLVVDPGAPHGRGRAKSGAAGDEGSAQPRAFTLRLLDEQDVGDLYTFCPSPGGSRQPPHVLSASGNRAVARWHALSVTLRFFHAPGEPFVRIVGTIDSLRPNHRLWLRTAIRPGTERSVAVSPFELVERGPASEGSRWEPPSTTWPARGAVLAGGVALLAEGVVEYEVAEDELGVVLQRAVGTISRKALATRPVKAGPDIPTPAAQLLGRMEFALAVRPGADRASLLDDWERYALPLLEVDPPGPGTPFGDAADGDLSGHPPGNGLSGRLLEVTGARLSAVRRTPGDGIEVRIWNDTGERAAARVAGCEVDLGPCRIETVRLPD